MKKMNVNQIERVVGGSSSCSITMNAIGAFAGCALGACLPLGITVGLLYVGLAAGGACGY